MKQELIRQRLYEKYIAPTLKEKENWIGIEIEMPIVNLNKEAVDFSVIHEITARFMERFGFRVHGRDAEGNIYAAIHETSGDILSYDCSYNNLELSLGKEASLHAIDQKFRQYYTYLQEELGKFHYTLTGMGINPYRDYNHNVPIPNGRYRMLFHHLASYTKYVDLPMYFHDYPAYGTFASASQVQLDITYEKLIPTINAFTRLEPLKAVLFSNAVLLKEHEELACCRDMFWENSTHGINPHNIGMYELELRDADELLDYIESTSIYCVERGEKYINFPPIRITEYFNRPFVTGEYYDEENREYREIRVVPELDDIRYLRTFKFEDLTFRGTIEYRSVCCQPIRDFMTVAAFHLGLKDKASELQRLLIEDRNVYHRGYNPSELRRLFNRVKLPEFIEADALYDLIYKVLKLAEQGLQERGCKEEIYLKPLFDRAAARMNPAQRLLAMKNQGVDMETIILQYAKLS